MDSPLDYLEMGLVTLIKNYIHVMLPFEKKSQMSTLPFSVSFFPPLFCMLLVNLYPNIILLNAGNQRCQIGQKVSENAARYRVKLGLALKKLEVMNLR